MNDLEPTELADPDFEKIIARVYWLKQEARAREQEASDLLDRLGDLDIRDYPAGKFILQVTETRRFNPDYAQRNLTEEEYRLTLATKPDATTAKKALSPASYAKTQRVYGLTRSVISVTDEGQ